MDDWTAICQGSDITLAVLAGGAGTRMGRAKSMLTLGGRPILEVLLENFQWIGPTMLVTAPSRQRPTASERFEREVVDSVADGGPLVGICTALEHVHTQMLIVATVDMPGVGPGQLRWLGQSLPPGELGLMGKRLVGGSEQIEPFPSIYRREALEPLRAHLQAGHRSVHSILKLPGFGAANTPADWPASVWTNLNYPADVEALGEFPPRLEKMESPILEFYRNRRPDSERRLLAQIWRWDHDRLEQCHDFIQWMFPLEEPSSVNPDAPLLTPADRAAFAADPSLRSAIGRSLKLFLDFLGLQILDDGQVVKATHFDSRIAIWKYTNHNWLRITRMLKSLRLLGLETEAGQVWKCLRKLHEEDGYVSAHSFGYWQDAAAGQL